MTPEREADKEPAHATAEACSLAEARSTERLLAHLSSETNVTTNAISHGLGYFSAKRVTWRVGPWVVRVWR